MLIIPFLSMHYTIYIYSVVQKDGLNLNLIKYLLKLVIASTNALPRWRLNVETKTKRTLHSSRRLNF